MKFFAVVLALCATTALGDVAKDCDPKKCGNENCRCSSATPPIEGTLPQLVSLTFNEAIVTKYFDKVWQHLLQNRKNADGSIASATFFVPHEYTDYSLVQKLYNMGHEIGVHSITKNHEQKYWRESPLDVLVEEFDGQRQILHKFAKIPTPVIRGVRAPQLQFNGDITFEAYRNASFVYDNSWPVADERLFPYTLDYKSTENCEATLKCPQETLPGFWVNPILDLSRTNGKPCHEIYGCERNGSALDIANWLMNEVKLSYDHQRAPVTLLADASWFDDVENSLDGMVMFLDNLSKMKDVFLVSQFDVVQWMRKPVTADKFHPTSKQQTLKCDARSCLFVMDGKPRTMISCVPCPPQYPWLGNPTGHDVSSE